MNRTDYLNGRVDHQTFYLAVADAIGRSALEHIVLRYVASAKVLAESSDQYFNDIPLWKWDRCHEKVNQLVAQNARSVMEISWSGAPLRPRTYAWSLSESVCVLKAIAREIARGLV